MKRIPKKYNLYLILTHPENPEKIRDLVVAYSTRQARWLAWKYSGFAGPKPQAMEMPPFITHTRIKDVSGPSRIASREARWPSWLWHPGH